MHGERDAFSIVEGEGPIVAAAIHAGHDVRGEVLAGMALDEATRLREEDPYTDRLLGIGQSTIAVHRSRFEVDMNRSREGAVYLTPQAAWGLEVWKEAPTPEVLERSLAIHDRFFGAVEALLASIKKSHGHFFVFDIHSYNHRRKGAFGPATKPAESPDINLGTESVDPRWRRVVEACGEALRSSEISGRPPDVRENVCFKGGWFPRWINRKFCNFGCAVAVELKKTFMNEWTGELDEGHLAQIRRALGSASRAIEKELE